MSSSRREFIGQLAGGSLVGLLALKGVDGVKPAEAPVEAPPPRSTAPKGMSERAARFIVTSVGTTFEHDMIAIVELTAEEVMVEKGKGPKKPDLRIPPPRGLGAPRQPKLEEQGILSYDMRDEVDLRRDLDLWSGKEYAPVVGMRRRTLSVRVAFDEKDGLAQKLVGVNAGDIMWIEVQGVEPL